ncbi:HSP18 transcriptional regulator [Pseudonocardiaceae bacterium YIM PH 21723]|nr:HSP18 transcriptional regulator [Pseudonocardiaceae bacterium YIM PH 21723]
MEDSVAAARTVQQALAAVRGGTETDLLHALETLRLLRTTLAEWEPELITAARAEGISWAALAGPLGVASRQAAERRHLRLQPSSTGEANGEDRVDAQRDRRAVDRAINGWARENSATLRKLAGQISGLDGLSPDGRHHAEQLGEALGGDDASSLLRPLADTHQYLRQDHGELARQVQAITDHTDDLRSEVLEQRRHSR